MILIVAVFSSTYYTKYVAKSMANLINQLCGDFCPEEVELYKDYKSTHGCLTSLRNIPLYKQSGYLLAPIPTSAVS